MKGKTKTPSIPKPFSPRQMGGEPSPNIEGIKSSSRNEIPRMKRTWRTTSDQFHMPNFSNRSRAEYLIGTCCI